MATRRQVVDEARKWVGVKWRHMGRDRAGIDCGGLVCNVANALGVEHIDMRIYSHVPDGFELRAVMDKCLDRIDHTAARYGDLVLMRWDRMPVHIGILSDTYQPLGLIHAYAAMRGVVEHTFSGEWPARTCV